MNFHLKLINFFKNHNMYNEKMFQYLSNNTTGIDYNIEELQYMIGCFYILDKDDILKKLMLNIPFLTNEETALISIHELTHGIEHYPKIGKKFEQDITIETLPLLYEKLYILENATPELVKYGQKLDEMIYHNGGEEYLFGLRIRDELLKHYNHNMQDMKKLSKKLSKKYKS